MAKAADGGQGQETTGHGQLQRPDSVARCSDAPPLITRVRHEGAPARRRAAGMVPAGPERVGGVPFGYPSQGLSGERLQCGPPKAQPARKRSGKRTAGPDGLWRAAPRGVHRRGAARWAPDLSGQRTEGRQVAGPAAFFHFRPSGRRMTWDCALRFTTRTSPPAHAWSISAAGTCPSTTARRSRSTTPCAATPACSMSRTCASSTCAAPGCANSCAGCSPTTSPG